MIEERSEWGRRILAGEPEPYRKQRGLVPIKTILGADNNDLMTRLNDAIASLPNNRQTTRVAGLPLTFDF